MESVEGHPDFYEIVVIGRYLDGSVHVRGWEAHRENVGVVTSYIEDDLRSFTECWYTPDDVAKIEGIGIPELGIHLGEDF